MRLLVTRPEPDASRLADVLKSLGHEPILQPLLTFESTVFDIGTLYGAGSLLISSGNALRALETTGHVSRLQHLPLFCVGAETARKAQTLGFSTISAVAETGSLLAEHILKLPNCHQPLVHATGEHQAFDFSKLFSQHQLKFYTLGVYNMQARASFDGWLLKAFENDLVDGGVFLSPRTAEVFVDLCRKHCLTKHAEKLRCYCLSNDVALKLNCLRPKVVIIAGKPSLQALLSLLGAK